MTTDWLGERLHDESIRIADCRFYLADPSQGLREYRESHVPTAKYFSLDDDLAGSAGPGRHPLPDPAAFTDLLRRSGLGDDHTLVIYDDGSVTSAARMWWMLRSLGHPNVTVLDGGWAAWSAEARSVTTEVPDRDFAELTLAREWSGTVTREQIIPSEDLMLIDSRAAVRYRGEEEPIDPVAGHIPGSVNIPYQDNVDELGRFRTNDELRHRFEAIDGTKTVAFYCGSGVTACNNILASEIAGYPSVLLYPGSWSDWCASGGEVATA